MRALSSFSLVHFMVAGQLCLLAGVFLFATFAPPRQGLMIVLPLWPSPTGSTANWVIARNGRIAGASPLGGGLLIYGERDALLGPALVRGAIVIGLPAWLCGQPAVQNWR